MRSASEELFHYARGLTAAVDIAAFAPSDPGYANYVRAFKEIWGSGKLPREADFDITETIGLSWWSKPGEFSEPVRFRKFRIFVTSVGLALSVGDRDRGILTPNYLAITLIDDAVAIGDPALLRLLVPAFQEFHDRLDQRRHEESPFLVLALLLLHFLIPAAGLDADQLGRQLIAEESQVEFRKNYDFLWGCTLFNQLLSCWQRHVSALIPARSVSLKMVRCGLLEKNKAT